MHRHGATLPELAIYLVLVGMAAQFFIEPARRQADTIALVGVREEIVSLLHRARTEARLHGQARVRLGEDGVVDLSSVVTERDSIRRIDLSRRDVELEIVGPRDEVRLIYGSLGVAQFASTSLVLRRRASDLRIVISSYGRVRR